VTDEQSDRLQPAESPLAKKLEKMPATAVTTSLAHSSNTTSTTLPTAVSGFLSDDETVNTCTVEKNSESPKPWITSQLTTHHRDHRSIEEKP
jgi:hypothetical protein